MQKPNLNATLRKCYNVIGDEPRRDLKKLYLQHTDKKSAVGGSRFMSIMRGETVLDSKDIYVFATYFGLSVKQLLADTLPDLDIQNLTFETDETARFEAKTFALSN